LEGISSERWKGASAKAGQPPTSSATSKAGFPAAGTVWPVSDPERAFSALTRSPTLLSKVASLFGSRALLCDQTPDNAAPSRRKIEGSPLRHHRQSHWRSIFPASHAPCRSSSSPSKIRCDEEHIAAGEVGIVGNVHGLDTFWSVGL
jgi:hypothetical protein